MAEERKGRGRKGLGIEELEREEREGPEGVRRDDIAKGGMDRGRECKEEGVSRRGRYRAVGRKGNGGVL